MGLFRRSRPKERPRRRTLDEWRARSLAEWEEFPIHRSISLNLDWCRMIDATAIIIGTPADLPDVLRNQIPSLVAETDQFSASVPRAFTPSAAHTSTRLRSSDGSERVPQWLRKNGEYHWFWGVPVAQLIYYLEGYEDRLVSIGATSRKEQPVRFIEYRPMEKTDVRWFAEVELWLDANQTFRIEILKHRQESQSVRAVPWVN